MPRLGYMIVDGLAFVLVAVGLTAVVVGYERNLPDPAAQVAQAAQGTALAPDWMDPETTGAITPKVSAVDAARTGAGSKREAKSQSPDAESGVWVDPPRRWRADERG
ncbi:MAG: hypothetical protein MIL41_13200 [Hyphomicrobiales bacterium]|mgnify:CR=1 FL=1|jgi:hypothetical protein